LNLSEASPQSLADVGRLQLEPKRWQCIMFDIMIDRAEKQVEVEGNYRAFREMLPELLKTHAGKFAVMRQGKIEVFFDTARDAMVHATRAYPDGKFSVQEVTDTVVDFGWFSHAPHHALVRS
jgi:hypothetical protein